MAMIGFEIPEATRKILQEIEVPDARPAQDHHITVLHLGDDIPIKVLAQAMVSLYEVASRTQPLTVQTSRIINFPQGSEGYPVVAEVTSPALHTLWERICDCFDRAGIDYSRRFPRYRPHVTLAWSDRAVQDLKIPEIRWGAHEVVVWGSNRGDGRVMIRIPLSISGSPTKTQIVRTIKASRLADRFRAGDIVSAD